MAKQDVSVELYYSGGWQDVTSATLADQGIELSRGLADETLEPSPGRVNLAFRNPNGECNPNNPVSPLYGLVGRNTPLRVSVGGAVQQVAEAAAWKPTRPLKAESRTAVEGAGVLRRLGRGKTPLRPSLERATLAGPPVGYWRLDDGEAATEGQSAVPGGLPVTFDSSLRPGLVDGTAAIGTAKSPEWVSGTTVSGLVSTSTLATSSTTTYSIDMMVRFGTGLGGIPGTTVFGGWTATGSAATGRIKIDGAPGSFFILYIELDNGTAFEDVGVFITDENEWHHVRFTCTQNGGNIDIASYLDGAVSETDTLTGSTLGRFIEGRLGGANASGSNTLESLSFRHLTIWDGAAPATADAATGYLGETAADRIERLCTEEDIPITVVGTAADSEPMGAQPSDTLTELLLQCARTDAGMLFEDKDALGFVYRVRTDLYNQDPALTLDFGAQEIAPPLEPVIGDLFVRNDVEAKSATGSARASLSTGAMSTQDPPNGVGRYDTTLDVNPSDDGRLPALAGWHLGRGTIQETRFRTVIVDLDAAPGRAAEVAAVDLGDLVVLTGLDPDDSPDDARGLVVNIAQSVGSHRRLVTFTLIPASAFDVGTIGANSGSVDVRGARIDTKLSTLNASVTAYATSLTVATTGGILWTTTAAHFNTALHGGGLFISVGGETMRVTNITGASSPQTFTVVRSINGVVKAHSSGAQVRVRYPARIGI